MVTLHHRCPLSVCRLWQISMSLKVFLTLTHALRSWLMICSPWWRKRSQTKRYLHSHSWIFLVPLHFFWVLNTILFILSGAHQFLANYGTAEEMSGLPWNTYWRRFYYPVWCEPRKEPWRYSGQFLTWTKCGPCLGHILSFPDIPILDVSCYHGCSSSGVTLTGEFGLFSHLLTKDFCFIVNMFVILFYRNFFSHQINTAFMNPSPSDCERVFCALLCSKRPDQTPKECSVCDRQEWLHVWTKDAAGEWFWPVNVPLQHSCLSLTSTPSFFRHERQW